MERWDDLTQCFGCLDLLFRRRSERFDFYVFEDCLSRPRFELLKCLLGIGKWRHYALVMFYQLRLLQMGDFGLYTCLAVIGPGSGQVPGTFDIAEVKTTQPLELGTVDEEIFRSLDFC